MSRGIAWLIRRQLHMRGSCFIGMFDDDPDTARVSVSRPSSPEELRRDPLAAPPRVERCLARDALDDELLKKLLVASLTNQPHAARTLGAEVADVAR